MRIQWIKANSHLEDIKDLNLELSRIRSTVNHFYNLVIENNKLEKNILKVFEAKACFETALTMVKGLIEPETNDMIDKLNKDQMNMNYDKIKDYFDNLLAILDKEGESLKTQVSVSNGKIQPSYMARVYLTSYREKLKDYMSNLIVYPFINASRYYKILDKKIKEDESRIKIFEYLLFREVFISAKIKGSSIRHKSGSAIGNATFHETNAYKITKPRDSTMNDKPLLEVEEEFPDLFYNEQDFENTSPT